MKKLCNILLTVIITVVLVYVGTGADFVRCAHTGRVTLLHMSAGGTHNNCAPSSDCMSVSHVELSPATSAQVVSHNFAVTPLAAVVVQPAVHIVVRACDAPRQRQWLIFGSKKSPPRDYLNLLQSFLI